MTVLRSDSSRPLKRAKRASLSWKSLLTVHVSMRSKHLVRRQFRLTNVNEVPFVHDVVDKLAAGGVGLEAVSPVYTQAESLVLPGEEADALDNGGLDNLLAGEDTPGDGIGAVRGGVGLELSIFGDGVVGQVGVGFDALDDLFNHLGRHEQLEISLLVDVAVGRAPSVNGM